MEELEPYLSVPETVETETVLLGWIYCAAGIWDMEKSYRQVRQTDFCFGVDPVLYLGPLLGLFFLAGTLGIGSVPN